MSFAIVEVLAIKKAILNPQPSTSDSLKWLNNTLGFIMSKESYHKYNYNFLICFMSSKHLSEFFAL